MPHDLIDTIESTRKRLLALLELKDRQQARMDRLDTRIAELEAIRLIKLTKYDLVAAEKEKATLKELDAKTPYLESITRARLNADRAIEELSKSKPFDLTERFRIDPNKENQLWDIRNSMVEKHDCFMLLLDDDVSITASTLLNQISWHTPTILNATPDAQKIGLCLFFAVCKMFCIMHLQMIEDEIDEDTREAFDMACVDLMKLQELTPEVLAQESHKNVCKLLMRFFNEKTGARILNELEQENTLQDRSAQVATFLPLVLHLNPHPFRFKLLI